MGEVDVHVFQLHDASTSSKDAGGASTVSVDLYRTQGHIVCTPRLYPYRRTAAGVFNTHALGQQAASGNEQAIGTGAVDLDHAVAQLRAALTQLHAVGQTATGGDVDVVGDQAAVAQFDTAGRSTTGLDTGASQVQSATVMRGQAGGTVAGGDRATSAQRDTTPSALYACP
ncbi:hypothetical protein D3C81_1766260 [compost metagenome]